MEGMSFQLEEVLAVESVVQSKEMVVAAEEAEEAVVVEQLVATELVVLVAASMCPPGHSSRLEPIEHSIEKKLEKQEMN